MKQMIKLGLILALYAAASCFCLSLVNMVTSPVIAGHANEALKAGLKEVFSEAQKFSDPLDSTLYTAGANAKIDNVYQALDGSGNVIGVVIEFDGKTYDHARMIAGFRNDKDLTITGVKFLELSDSPGFGQRAQDPKEILKGCGKTFYGQFEGKKASEGFVLGNTYEAISGATITSTSVGKLLEQAAFTAGEVLGSSSIKAPAKVRSTPFTEAEALSEIFGENTVNTVAAPAGCEKAFTASDSSGVTGAAVIVSGKSFNDKATLLIAVNKDSIIAGVRVLYLNDTPGLGQKALEESFYSQFTGKKADTDFTKSGTYDAIASATITSNSLAQLIKTGAELALQTVSQAQ